MDWNIYRMPLGASTAIGGTHRHAWVQPQEDYFTAALAAANAKGIQIAPDANALIGLIQGVQGNTATVFSTADTKGHQVMISTDTINEFAAWWVA